ncbi:MAG: 4-hydroxybenzoate polyprenyltransferase [Gammaproteobacteria bacterium]|jgi:4-hydroxybenzoate polyprenyltransferase
MKTKLSAYARLMRLDRPVGNYLLLWPTLWALWFAAISQGAVIPAIPVMAVFIAGVFLMRAAGCVINDFADRKIDGQVDRTKARPLATGEVSPKEALVLFFALTLAAFCLVLTMNSLTIKLSFVGAALATLYPFTKRWTHLPQFVLGAAFGWAVPMAFAAQANALPPLAWILFSITILWTVAYDTMYAMVDREDDLKIGVKSTAILFGRFDRLIIALLQLSTLILLVFIGILQQLNWPYYLGLCAAAGLALWQQWLIKERHGDRCFKAFLNNHPFGLVVFIGIAGSALL